MTRRWHFILFVAVVAYLALFYNLGNMAFIGADEARYARVAEEMNLSGNYTTPTLNFRPWLEKPPLLYWMEAGGFLLFGVSEWSARFPVAFSACAVLLLCAFLLRRNAGEIPAMASVLVLVTSPLFFVYGRAASTDMPLVVTLTAAFVFGYEATRSRALVWPLLAGACLGLAALAKGPVALVLFGGTFFLLFLLTQRYGWTWLGTLLGLAAFLAVAVPWYWKVWLENGYHFIVTFWLNHNVARFLTPIHHHSQPFWYYIPVLLLGFFPWTFFLVPALVRLWQNRKEILDPPIQLFLLLWAAVPLLFFSASDSKLAGYILPAFPGIAMLVGIELDKLQVPDLRIYRLNKIVVSIMVALGLLLALAVTFGFHFTYRSIAVGALLGLPLAGGMLGTHYYWRRSQPALSFFLLVGSMTLFVALAFWKAAPILDDFHSARDVSRVARGRLSETNPLLMYRYFHHTASYYTGYRVEPQPIQTSEELARYMAEHPRSDYVVLTQKPGWLELTGKFKPSLILHKGNLYLAEIKSTAAENTR